MVKDEFTDMEIYENDLMEWQESSDRLILQETICNRLTRYCRRKGMKKLIEDLKVSGYFDAPASTRFHEASFGGLARHSLDVANRFLDLTTKEKLNFPTESALICGYLHDLCKVNLYKPNFTQKGKRSKIAWKQDEILPVGHGEKSIILIERFIDLTPKELIIIRWHMGNYDYSFRNYEDRATKLCPEVKLFSACDMISSVLELMKKGANGE